MAQDMAEKIAEMASRPPASVYLVVQTRVYETMGPWGWDGPPGAVLYDNSGSTVVSVHATFRGSKAALRRIAVKDFPFRGPSSWGYESIPLESHYIQLWRSHVENQGVAENDSSSGSDGEESEDADVRFGTDHPDFKRDLAALLNAEEGSEDRFDLPKIPRTICVHGRWETELEYSEDWTQTGYCVGKVRLSHEYEDEENPVSNEQLITEIIQKPVAS